MVAFQLGIHHFQGSKFSGAKLVSDVSGRVSLWHTLPGFKDLKETFKEDLPLHHCAKLLARSQNEVPMSHCWHEPPSWLPRLPGRQILQSKEDLLSVQICANQFVKTCLFALTPFLPRHHNTMSNHACVSMTVQDCSACASSREPCVISHSLAGTPPTRTVLTSLLTLLCRGSCGVCTFPLFFPKARFFAEDPGRRSCLPWANLP